MQTDANKLTFTERLYEHLSLLSMVPKQLELRDELAAKEPYHAEYQRSKLCPRFPAAVYGFTKAMYYCRRDLVPSWEGAAANTGEHFVECLKLSGKEIMGEETFDLTVEWLKKHGQEEWIRKGRKALKNRRNYQPRSAVDLKLGETILVLWLPWLLWLVRDDVAVVLLSNLEVGPPDGRRRPFAKLNAGAYGQARLRLEKLGLKRWCAFYGDAPVRDYDVDTKKFQFAPPEDCGGFDFRVR